MVKVRDCGSRLLSMPGAPKTRVATHLYGLEFLWLEWEIKEGVGDSEMVLVESACEGDVSAGERCLSTKKEE